MVWLQGKFEYMRGAPQITEIAERLDLFIDKFNETNADIDLIYTEARKCLINFYRYNNSTNDPKFHCLLDLVDIMLQQSNSDFLQKYIYNYYKMPWYGDPFDIIIWHIYAINVHAHADILQKAEKGLVKITTTLKMI